MYEGGIKTPYIVTKEAMGVSELHVRWGGGLTQPAMLW